jgi:hypothetical protein
MAVSLDEGVLGAVLVVLSGHPENICSPHFRHLQSRWYFA